MRIMLEAVQCIEPSEINARVLTHGLRTGAAGRVRSKLVDVEFVVGSISDFNVDIVVTTAVIENIGAKGVAHRATHSHQRHTR